MPDFHFEDVEMTIGTEGVTFTLTLVGTAQSGQSVRVDATISYRIEAGLITGIEAWLDPATVGDLIGATTPSVET